MNAGNRVGRCLSRFVVTASVLLAVGVSTMRVMLPQLNHYRESIEHQLSEHLGADVQIGTISGEWHNLSPSLSLSALAITSSTDFPLSMSAQSVEIELNLWQSLLQWQPVLARFSADQLHLDLRQLELFDVASDTSSTTAHSASSQSSPQSEQKRLENLLLRQFEYFSLQDSEIRYRTPSGDDHDMKIERVSWINRGSWHHLNGVARVSNEPQNTLQIHAEIQDHGTWQDLSGTVYIEAKNQNVRPWLKPEWRTPTKIEEAYLSFHSWIQLEHSDLQQAYIQLEPSQLTWEKEQRHQLQVNDGVFQISKQNKKWQVSGHSLSFDVDEHHGPATQLALSWRPDQGWLLNLSQIEIATLTPLISLLPSKEQEEPTQTALWLEKLRPSGLVDDLRISMGTSLDTLHYSARLSQGALQQWKLLPEVHHLSATLSGNDTQAQIKLSLLDDVLPYGDVFQAPLNIKQGEVDIVWQKLNSGWRLWADKVSVATPDLQVLGAFRLDFPPNDSPFLSFYAETDLLDAGQTWRYLPTLALGPSLTHYLSDALQAGEAKSAKLLWFGPLHEFPYSDHNGIFQAQVGLTNAQYQFAADWPPLENMQLDLLFQNNALFLDSKSADLAQIHAQRITGTIPKLASDGHIDITAQAEAEGQSVREYMNSTPLARSVGSALNAVQVTGPVQSEFQLNIPFHKDHPARAWGWAQLHANEVAIQSPKINLDQVSGRIAFDNDVIHAEELHGLLLDQPVNLNIHGSQEEEQYGVAIQADGQWQAALLAPYLGKRWVDPVSGQLPWKMDLGIQLKHQGFSYQLDTQADLQQLESRYPYPLAHQMGQAGKLHLHAKGDERALTANASLPYAQYQATIDIQQAYPQIRSSSLLLGDVELGANPMTGNHAQANLEALNIDEWITLLNSKVASSATTQTHRTTSPMSFPLPERVALQAKSVTLGGLDWHDVTLDAHQNRAQGKPAWSLTVESQELAGVVSYASPERIEAQLDKLHLDLPQLKDDKEVSADLPVSPQKTMLQKTMLQKTRLQKTISPKTTELDQSWSQSLYEHLPNIMLNVQDFSLQGHQLGQLDIAIQRQADQLALTSFKMQSGDTQITADGTWRVGAAESRTQLNVDAQGKDNAEFLDRLGIHSGIKQAPFHIAAQTQWQGTPWDIHIDTLEGKLNTQLGKGIITNVNGAVRVLGIFSLDSILRKMQLDFSGLFDDGMAFNSISGSGDIRHGILLTDDLNMDALAGKMTIKGMANLNDQTVDADVHFVPDLTSGIPVLSAFAVTPQTALYVLAVTTVLSPVIDVFTQVDYQVKGAMDSPKVTELSRRKEKRKVSHSLSR